MDHNLDSQGQLSSIEIENRNKEREKRNLFLLSLAGLLLFVVIWELVVGVGIVPKKFLAPPSTVFVTFINKFTEVKPDGATLQVHFISSFILALTGFLVAIIIGTPLGLFMGYFKAVDKVARPIFDLIRPIPPLAWIPLSILWLGIGMTAKAYIIFLAAFVPCVINSYTGVKLTNIVLINVAKTCGADRLEIFTKICVPSALPLVFTGFRIALGNAWSTLVAAELLASTCGLGYMIQQGRSLVRPDIIIVGMLTIGFTGALMAYAVNKLEDTIVPWRVKK
jgi:taurine transport system permease protein